MSNRSFRVEWTDSAYRDLSKIVSYIARDNPGSARKLYATIQARAKSLRQNPNRGRIVPELLALVGDRSYREIIIGPFRMIYRVEGASVFVLGVFDGRRDLEEVLLERMVGGGEPDK